MNEILVTEVRAGQETGMLVPAPAQPPSMAERLSQVEDHTRLVLAHRIRTARAAAPDPEETAAPARLVPVPRRARMFVLHGPAQGFADVVLTSPPRTPRSLFAVEQRSRTQFG